MLNSIKSAVGRYFKGSDSLQGQPLPEVNKALIEDAPRVIRLTTCRSAISALRVVRRRLWRCLSWSCLLAAESTAVATAGEVSSTLAWCAGDLCLCVTQCRPDLVHLQFDYRALFATVAGRV